MTLKKYLIHTLKLKENLAFNNTRLVYGFYILFFVASSFIFTLDYVLYALIFLLVIYDLFYSKIFINAYFLLIFIVSFFVIYFLLSPIINTNSFLILFFFFFLFSLFQSKNLNIYFSVSVLIFLIIFLNILQNDRDIVYILLFCSFINDTSAYVIGRYLKGPKIIPLISPNKTWSGTVSSFLITTLIFFYFFDFDILHSLVISSLFFFGDIYFSSIKRKFNLKDFSKSLKGHGGILDRLDSIFLSTFYLHIFII